jgi:adenylate cyclase
MLTDDLTACAGSSGSATCRSVYRNVVHASLRGGVSWNEQIMVNPNEINPDIHAPESILVIVEWLSSDQCHELDDAGLIAGLGRRLRAAGPPVDRISLHLRTLHPEFLGRTLAWAPNEPVEIHDREHGIEVSQAFMDSPVAQVLETGQPLVVRRADDDEAAWTKIDIYQGRQLTELVIVPLHNAEGPMSAATFGTLRPAGFSATDVTALERIVPALRNACELRTLRRVELTLLNTYVGATTGRRILAGRIRRGQIESLDAALMLCDLPSLTWQTGCRPNESSNCSTSISTRCCRSSQIAAARS